MEKFKEIKETNIVSIANVKLKEHQHYCQHHNLTQATTSDKSEHRLLINEASQANTVKSVQ